jgi:hypothetical protein
MSNFFVMLVFQISHLQKQTSDFQDWASLKLEHSELNTYFMDRH